MRFAQPNFPSQAEKWVSSKSSWQFCDVSRWLMVGVLAWELIRKLLLDTFLQKMIPVGREDVS